MTRHYTEHDFPDAMRLQVHAVTIYCRSDAERKAVIAAAQRVPVAPAFVPTPFGYAGEPQDPPEPDIRIRPLDDGYLVTDTRGPQVWQGAAVTLSDAEQMARYRLNPGLPTPPPGPVRPPSEWGPPNCDFVSHPQAGEALAQAQHEAAESGEQCTSGACLLTRGSD